MDGSAEDNGMEVLYSAVVCGTTNKPNPVIECTPGNLGMSQWV